ncbi:FISUMP domain-containing protein [Fibrobacter sp.]|uniref:FISUMP domain-containing protein n=1 Tax=Fibrobacter sp. TaxID=35828 RepID=UPI00388CF9D7
MEGPVHTAVGGSSTAGSKLKSQTGWVAYSGITNEDAFGFSALPAGYRNRNGNYGSEGGCAWFWSSTDYDSNFAYYMYLNFNYFSAGLGYENGKHYGFPVRCLKDSE